MTGPVMIESPDSRGHPATDLFPNGIGAQAELDPYVRGNGRFANEDLPGGGFHVGLNRASSFAKGPGAVTFGRDASGVAFYEVEPGGTDFQVARNAALATQYGGASFLAEAGANGLARRLGFTDPKVALLAAAAVAALLLLK